MSESMFGKDILLVDDDSFARQPIEIALTAKGYQVDTAADGRKAVERLEGQNYDLVLSDIKMPNMDGLELLETVRRRAWDMPFILITAHGTIESAVRAMREGAYDYVQKPVQLDELEIAVERALDHQDKRRENHRLRSELQNQYSSANMIGKAPSMAQVFDLVDTVAPSRATVLVSGESGTGKELVARALHYNSDRRTGPFIRLNCAALPKELMESELFGHEKGAFTGAIRQTRGRFEMADGGTLLLDEISEIDLSLQAKLLRVLQEREFERLGGGRTIAVDVRIVATTNRNLLDEVEAGRFRQDLYYRLNVIEIELPPLRQRRQDIPSLAQHFIELFSGENGKAVEGLAEEALELLLGHHWPGNVRELENCLERAVVVGRGPVLQIEDLPRALIDGRPATEAEDLPEGMILHEMERRLILRTLQECGGKRAEAALRLGITPRTLRNKLRQYGAMDAFKKRIVQPALRTGSR